MKPGQAATGLLGRHGLRNFRSDLLKPALSIKAVGGFLNPGSAHDHLRESERTRFRLGTTKHALRDARPAVASIEVHPAKLRLAGAAAFDTEGPDNLVYAFDNPERIAPCPGKH